jgi:hypothetical protein
VPPIESAAACSLPPLQKTVGVFGFFLFCFFLFLLFLNTVNAKEQETEYENT